MGKKELAAMFSSDPDRYYKVELFDKAGFQRQRCNICGKYFWSLVDRKFCPDHENYGFIGKPPTNKRLDYVNAWKVTQEHFKQNNHSIIRRYPVVCRWREDLYFTIASIVDFQRIMDGKVVFELPANPLVVPQMCLRFNDIENVGKTGRHFTGFCMIGQTCNADIEGGYWKDRCIELDYHLLTMGFGVSPQEITFVEDVWMGAGAFGYSLEYFVRGLELGNAVFTEFEGDENSYRTMPNKIIDMGAGLERLSWVTMGTPTGYDCSFGPVVPKLVDATAISQNPEILSKYFSAVSGKLEQMGGDISAIRTIIAKDLGISDDSLQKIVAPYEALYTIADHTRTLLFAISDGALPSNVGGGYNLRVILRRALSIVERFGWKISLQDIADLHIDYLKQMYPELEEHREDVRSILKIESGRYIGSKERMASIASSVKSNRKKLGVDDLIRMYESDGITPDFLVETGVIDSIPPTFYTRLAELHSPSLTTQSQKPLYGLEKIAPTRLLYYEDESMREFTAMVLEVIEKKFVILDQTAFYPRGGGQEPDTGQIGDIKVAEVTKQGQVVIHKLVSPAEDRIVKGQVVKGIVNDRRRNSITKHHTATHILNSSARTNLGSWVWQNSAFKDEKYARLDITHHSSLDNGDIERIEKTANTIIRRNLPVNINNFERGDAEQKYSFRIYQGGVVPSNNVRIVNIKDWDIEACGGTHVRNTGEIGLLKIIKSERIQDGVIRLEFVAGESAIDYVQKLESQLSFISQSLGSSKDKVTESVLKSIQDADIAKKKIKTILRKVSPFITKSIIESAKQISPDGTKIFTVYDEELDEDYYIYMGQRSIDLDPELVFIASVPKGQGIRVIVFVGEKARQKIKAGVIAQQLSRLVGGSGGGDDRFGQGGGRFQERIKESLASIEPFIIKTLQKVAEAK